MRPPAQQPFGQLFPLHSQMPVVVSHSPFAQEEHALPPVPHWVADSDANGTQSPAALQQPAAQVVGVHGTCASGGASDGASVAESCVPLSLVTIPVSVPT